MRVIVGVLAAAAFLGVMVYAVMQESRVRCEVCVEHRGMRACRSSTAIDRKSAISGAVTAACAVLSSGVTDGIDCGATPPSSLYCED